MEPRIATLLDTPYQDRTLYDPLVTPPSGTRRPPFELTSIGDDALPQANGLSNDLKARYQYGIQAQGRTSSGRTNPGAPIAQVLNNESPLLYASQPATAVLTSPTPPFSGRLGDLLLDPSEQANKRRKREQGPEQTAQATSENGVIKLPQPPQLPKKTTRRPRIPPLLQGLHQPPPLPEGRLFPPITSEKNAFARSPGERVGFDTYDEARSKAEDARLGARSASNDINSINHSDKSTIEHHAAPQTSPPKPVSELGNSKKSRSTETLVENASRNKSSRKRNKWSEQETKQLLLGVTKYGIGSWKKILQDVDYEFNGRTAVDCKAKISTAPFPPAPLCVSINFKGDFEFGMKDRFRVCYPGDAPKTRKSKHGKTSKEKQSEATSREPNVSEPAKFIRASNNVEVVQHIAEQQGEPTHDTTQPKTTELGVHGPFPKSTRRPKRPFNVTDDKNLLIGFEKHGPVWHNIRDDPDLGFTTRHPTDLRDRFRIKYPDLYAKAGYKLKPKEDRTLSSQSTKPIDQDQQQQQQPQLSNPSSETTRPALQVTYRGGPDAQLTPTTDRAPPSKPIPPPPSATPSSSLKSYFPLLFDATLLGDDVLSSDGDGDGDGSESPITLNRNILQWADANPSTLASFAAPQPPMQQGQTPYANYSAAALGVGVGTGTADPTSLYATHDGIHINPLATIKLPSTVLGYAGAAISYSASASTSTSTPPTTTTTTTAITQNSLLTTMPLTESRMNLGTTNMPSSLSASAYPRTPNLPTIVFPHVPVASARSAMHNLPTPADLLLGIDLERSEGGMSLDDALGLGMN